MALNARSLTFCRREAAKETQPSGADATGRQLGVCLDLIQCGRYRRKVAEATGRNKVVAWSYGYRRNAEGIQV